MTRPKRAAAARAVAQLVSRVASGPNDDDETDPVVDPPSPTTTASPARPLRRIPLRPPRAGMRDLARRRGIYERIAAHYIKSAASRSPTDIAATAASLQLSAPASSSPSSSPPSSPPPANRSGSDDNESTPNKTERGQDESTKDNTEEKEEKDADEADDNRDDSPDSQQQPHHQQRPPTSNSDASTAQPLPPSSASSQPLAADKSTDVQQPPSKSPPPSFRPPSPPQPPSPLPVAPTFNSELVLSVLERDDQSPARMHALLRQLQSVLNRRDPPPDPDEAPATAAGDSSAPHLRGLRFRMRHAGDADDLRGAAERLATPRFMSHASSAVRLLTACCLAEIFRVAAPDPPLEARKLNPVCSLFIEQLAVLVAPADGLEAFRFSLLEQLATVQTLVIFSDDQDVVANIFACFYAVSRDHQPPKVRQYFADILVSLLDEAETLDKEVLDALLAPLVPALNYSPPAVALAEKVVRDAAKIIQVPMSNLFNASIRALRGANTVATAKKGAGKRKSPAKKPANNTAGIDPDDLSEHHDNFTELLINVNRIAPDVLIYVLPNLEGRLRSPDLAVRHGAVALLARLFTTRANMSRSYSSLYSEFLSRNIDSSPEIRAEVVHAMGELISLPNSQSEHLDKMLLERLLDFDEKVRVATVRAVGKACDYVSAETIHRLVTRTQDRKAPVRSEALSQVILLCTETRKSTPNQALPVTSGIFEPQDSIDLSIELGNDSRGLSSTGPPESEAQTHDDALEERMLRWSFLPNDLLQAHMALRTANDFITAAEIEKIIFERICQPALRSDDPDLVRLGLRRFSIFLAHLTPSSFSSFNAIVNERTRARRVLKEIARLRLLARTKDKEQQDENRGKENNPENQNPNKPPAGTDVIKDSTNKDNVARTSRPWPSSKSSPSHGRVEEAAAIAQRFSVLFHGLAGSSGSVQDMCKTLATSVDLNVYKSFAKAVDSDLRNADYDTVAQDAVSRIGSKSTAGKLLQAYVLPKCRPGVMSSNCFNILCELATSEASTARPTSGTDNASETDPSQDPSFLLSGVLRLLEVLRRYSAVSLHSCTTSIRRLTSIRPKHGDYTADIVVRGLRLACAIPEQWRANVRRGDVWDGLLLHIFNEEVMNSRHAVRLAKWSTRLAIVTCSEEQSENFLEGLCKRISTSFDSFSGNLEALLGPVTAIAQMAKHAPAVFKKQALPVFDFMRTLLSGSLDSMIELPRVNSSPVESESPTENGAISDGCEPVAKTDLLSRDAPEYPYHHISNPRWRCVADVLCRAIKTLVYSLEHVDMREEFPNVISLLVNALQKGSIFGLAEPSSIENGSGNGSSTAKSDAQTVSALHRLRAACGLLFLAKHRIFFREFSPDMVCSTVSAANDKDAGTRLGFVRYVYNGVLRKRLPLRWVASLALMATDEKAEQVAKVKSMLVHVFHQRRLIFEKARREGKSSSAQLLPEATITDLIWILAHMPNVEKDQADGFPASSKCLELMLSSLLDSKDYEGLVNEYIESVTIAEDATERVDGGSRVNTERMVELGQIAGAILKKKQAGKKWVLSEHPNKIMLPRDFYRVPDRKEEVSGVVRPSIVDVARKYDVMDGKGGRPIPEQQHQLPANKVISKSVTPLKAVGQAGKRVRSLKLPEEDESEDVTAQGTISETNSVSSVRNSAGRGRKRKAVDYHSGEESSAKNSRDEESSEKGESMQVDKDDRSEIGADDRDQGNESELTEASVTSSGQRAKKQRKAREPPAEEANARPLRRSARMRKS